MDRVETLLSTLHTPKIEPKDKMEIDSGPFIKPQIPQKAVGNWTVWALRQDALSSFVMTLISQILENTCDPVIYRSYFNALKTQTNLSQV